MSLSLRLDVRQTQGLVMTPQLQQAIKLLQLSNLELQTFVENELEQNPFLERIEGEAESTTTERDEGTLDGELTMAASEPGDAWSGSQDDGWTDAADPMPAGLGVSDVASVGQGGRNWDGDDLDRAAGLSRPATLKDHLLEQLCAEIEDQRDRLIGVHLIDEIDEAGYFRGDLLEVADQLGVAERDVLEVLDHLQRFDPPGVGARSLTECLALQLQDQGRYDPAMARLLENLELVAQADLPLLVSACGILPDDLPDMLRELKALDPKPGLAFASAEVLTVVPDILVYRASPSRWRVELNGATLPKVLVNQSYVTEVTRMVRDERAKSFLGERLQTANWLVKALDQRAQTVLRVARAVIERQRPFLDHGVRHLRPLVLRDIATVTELHESTISRATADKYVATPRGTFPFKYFFSNALPGAPGEAGHAAEAIRQEIKGLIDGEPAHEILSDDQLVDVLKKMGIVIARRTVAKYRESMGIPSSVHRRRSRALRLA